MLLSFNTSAQGFTASLLYGGPTSSWDQPASSSPSRQDRIIDVEARAIDPSGAFNAGESPQTAYARVLPSPRTYAYAPPRKSGGSPCELNEPSQPGQLLDLYA